VILTLDSILRKVLSLANKEQSQMYPPSVFTQHINIVTNTIINELSQNYPKTQNYIDLISPFIEKKTLVAKNGQITLPENYRRLLSIGVFVTDKNGELCACDENGKEVECSVEFDGDVLGKTREQAEKEQVNRTCFSKKVDILSAGQWDSRTTHSYKQPKLDEPIACQAGRTIKICPANVGAVEIRYIRNPKEYIYGYVELPDGTYQFDASKSVKSEWHTQAEEYIVNAVATLYSVYTRDGEMEKGLATIKQMLY